MSTDRVDVPTVGIDLGGTYVRAAVVDGEGTVLREDREHTPQRGDAVATMATLVDAQRVEFPDVPAVGVGVAALVDLDGTARYAPNISGLRDAPLRRSLSRSTGLPVAVDNDANAAALGEARYGAARGSSHVLVITLGTGIGGGVVIDGVVQRGAHGFAAEVGHFQVDPDGPMCACGERGHWEALASGTALGRMGRARAADGRAAGVLAKAGGRLDAIDGELIGECARHEDADALVLLEQYAEQVAIGLAGLCNILDPERIVVSGGLVELGELLFTPLRAACATRIEGPEHRPVVAVLPAQLGERAGVIGAAAMAREIAR